MYRYVFGLICGILLSLSTSVSGSCVTCSYDRVIYVMTNVAYVRDEK